MSGLREDRRDPGRELDQVGGRGLLGGHAGACLLPLSASSLARRRTTRSSGCPATRNRPRSLTCSHASSRPTSHPAVVVYARASGLTAADRAKAAARRPALRRDPGRGPGPGDWPHPVGGRPGPADHRPGQPGHAGLKQRAGKAADAIRAIADSNANGLSSHLTGPLTSHITGPLGISADLQQGIRRHRQHAAVFRRGGRHRDLADHLPEPVAVAAAGDLLRGGADHRPGGDLPAGGARRADGHRAERRHLVRAGVRRQHRLRAADRRPVPGGTAPPRPPSPGDGRGAAPRRAGHHRQRLHRHRGAADAVRRGAELDQEPGAGAGHRRRGRHGLHAHPAARPDGDLPPRGLLALPAHLRLGRADLPGDVGPGRLGHRPPAAPGMGHHRRGPGRAGARPDRPEGQRPDQRASASAGTPTR